MSPDNQRRSLPSLKRGSRDRAGLRAWIWPFDMNLERWAYSIQRVTGVGIALYFLAHIVETGNVVGGAGVWSIPSYGQASEVWTATFKFLSNPFFDLGLSLISFAVFYHTINGVRLTLVEFGFIVGKPKRPDYPYVAESLNRVQQAIFWASIVIAGIATYYALSVFFG